MASHKITPVEIRLTILCILVIAALAIGIAGLIIAAKTRNEVFRLSSPTATAPNETQVEFAPVSMNPPPQLHLREGVSSTIPMFQQREQPNNQAADEPTFPAQVPSPAIQQSIQRNAVDDNQKQSIPSRVVDVERPNDDDLTIVFNENEWM